MAELQLGERHGDDPLISVVVISYNFERFLQQCLDSVIAQTLRPFEVIVYDDCSTDASWDIICDYAQRYPELIAPFRQSGNVGHIRNGTAARQRVRGELFSAIDGDDYWLPDKLQREWEALRANPHARSAYSNVFTVDAVGDETGVWHDGEEPQPPSGDVFVETLSRQFFVDAQSCYRNELNYTGAVHAIGDIAAGESLHPDWDLKIRMSARYPVVYSGATSVAYRSHDTNINATTTHDERIASMRAVFHRNRDLLLARNPDERAWIETQLSYLL